MAVNQTLASMSDVLVGSSMAVYTGALLAYAVDLSSLGVKRGAARSEQGQAAADVREPALVGAGQGDSSRIDSVPADSVSSAADADHDIVLDLRDDVAAPTLEDHDEIMAPRRSRAAGVGVSLTWVAFLLHLGSVVTRGMSASRVPWGNMYEFGLTGSVVVTGVFLAMVVANKSWRVLGAFVVGPVLLTLGACVLLFYTVSARLVPALQSGFLIVHVSVAFISTALFTLAFSVHILQLLRERRDKKVAESTAGQAASFMDRLPGADKLEQLGYRLVAISFPLWTFTLVAGAIWAEKAWNRYWGWDPKEVWTFVIWVVYAAYLHARATRGWSGAKCTVIAIVGFICVVLNYAVVNIYFTGMHSYSGIG